MNSSTILDLLEISVRFCLDELATFLVRHVIKHHLANLNFIRLYNICFKKDTLTNLQSMCADIAVKHPDLVFKSNDLKLFHEKALVDLIEKDELHLQMGEGKIWDYLIKWGIAQTALIPNPEFWIDECFEALKGVLSECLLHIRYHQFSIEDIFDKVQPYHRILDPKIWDDIVRRLSDPDSSMSSVSAFPQINQLQLSSNIITKEHVAEISSWIDKRSSPYNVNNNPYDFKLIYRASDNGFSAKKFYSFCKEIPKTVVIIKVKGTDEIFGGYNPLSWYRPNSRAFGFVETNGSFVFSLKNGSIRESILSRVRNPTYAINYSPYTEHRGIDFGGGDLKMKFDPTCRCCCIQTSYEYKIRNIRDDFDVEDYEAFQVVRKEPEIPNAM